MKICIACGMPMKDAADYAMGDMTKEYCRFCARPDGTMQSFSEKKMGLTRFLVETQGFDEEAAVQAAVAMMRKLPAWEANFS